MTLVWCNGKNNVVNAFFCAHDKYMKRIMMICQMLDINKDRVCENQWVNYTKGSDRSGFNDTPGAIVIVPHKQCYGGKGKRKLYPLSLNARHEKSPGCMHMTDIEGLAQDCSNSMELLQSCAKPLICQLNLCKAIVLLIACVLFNPFFRSRFNRESAMQCMCVYR